MLGESSTNLKTLQNLFRDGKTSLQRRSTAVLKQQLVMIEREERLLKKEGLDPTSLDPETLEKLRHIPFWCYDDDLHLRRPDDYQECGCCVNHVIGLPKHRITKMPTALAPFQVDYFQKVDEAKRRNAELQLPTKIHLNKGRQMGFTEITCRIIIYYSFSSYEGWNVGIIAATNGTLARKDLRRIKKMLHNIWEAVVFDIGSNYIHLANDTVIEAFPASEEAMTGDTQYKAIFMDEAAKWKNLDDTPIFNSIMPIVNSGAADLYLVSTPKGPIKMFYAIHKDPKDFIKFVCDIWCAEGNMYSTKQIKDMIANSKEDPNQEYLCKFTYGKNAILGTVDADIRDDELEWDAVVEKPAGRPAEENSRQEWTDPIADEPDNFIPMPEQK